MRSGGVWVRRRRGLLALVCGTLLLASCASGPADPAVQAQGRGGTTSIAGPERGDAALAADAPDLVAPAGAVPASSSEGEVASGLVDPASPTSVPAAEGDGVDGASVPGTDPQAPSQPAPVPTATPDGTPTAAFADRPRSAPATSPGTALLRRVRIGRHDGFERVVFELAGEAQPAYRVRWVDGPVLADGSGSVVAVSGAAHLEVVLSPASGVDLTSGEVVYEGLDRVTVPAPAATVTDLVRTGDFEGVLTWVVGASEPAPFRVARLNSPTRLVVDIATR